MQAKADNHEAERQYTTVSMDQNTISQGAQIPTCMQNTTLTSTSQVNPPAGNVFQSSQFSTKSNVGCRSDSDQKAPSTVEGQQNINPNNALTAEQQSTPMQTSTRKKEIQPDNFDGVGTTEWSGYHSL